MPVRSTMTAIISRVRGLINDPAGSSQVFTDQDVQDVLDNGRVDLRNEALKPVPTFSGSTIQYLDYYHHLGDWEDGAVFKQYLTVPVTPATSENIVSHWTFAQSTLPPVFISGSVHDCYRAAADLLERWAAKWVLLYNVSLDGQNLQRNQAQQALLNLSHTYRMQQRAHTIHVQRTDEGGPPSLGAGLLGPTEIDYMSSGD